MANLVIQPLLDKLVTELHTPETDGILLVGSYAKGTARSNSDIDLTHFVRDCKDIHSRSFLRDKVVISLLVAPIPHRQEIFDRPESAIFALPMWRSARILQDERGMLSDLQHYAQEYNWSRVQPLADHRASELIHLKAEEVLSLISALGQQDEWGTYALCTFIVNSLVTAVALHFGILIDNEKTFFSQVCSFVGPEHRWSTLLRGAAGLDGPSGNMTPMQFRTISTAFLFLATVQLLKSVLATEHQPLIYHTMQAIGSTREKFRFAI